MTQRPPLPPGEDEFDAALRERRRLLPRLDDALHGEEPPPELDRLVLDRARDALRRETPPERHYRSPRWAAPVAIAATVLLSFALVTQMAGTGDLRGDATLLEADLRGDATLSQVNEDAAPDSGNTTPGTTAPAEVAAPATPKPASTSTSTPESASARAPAPASASAPAPAPPPERAYSAASAAPPASATVTAAPPSPSVAAQAMQPASRAEALAMERPQDRGEDELSTMADVATRRQAAPAAPPGTARAPTAEPARSAAKAAAARATAAAAPAADDAADSADSADANREPAIPRTDPQRWLAAIERLQAAGDLETARRELAAFRQRYPDRPLPSSLDTLQ